MLWSHSFSGFLPWRPGQSQTGSTLFLHSSVHPCFWWFLLLFF